MRAVCRMTTIKKHALVALLSVFLCHSVFAADKTSPDQAKEFIQQLGNEAVKLLSDKQLPISQREAKIRNNGARASPGARDMSSSTTTSAS